MGVIRYETLEHHPVAFRARQFWTRHGPNSTSAANLSHYKIRRSFEFFSNQTLGVKCL